MTRDTDIPTIFNPRRVRTPSVVVTGEEGFLQPQQQQQQQQHQVPNGPFATPPAQATTTPAPGGGAPGGAAPHINHSDSVTSSQHEHSEAAELPQVPAAPHQPPGAIGTRLKACSGRLCSKSARKVYFGVCVTVCVTASWVGATHCIKYLYSRRPVDILPNPNMTVSSIHSPFIPPYNAPFFTTWFCTNWTILFFPLYLLSSLILSRCKSSGDSISENIRNFREKGLTTGRFLTRCGSFCLLWVGTNYMYIRSLRILSATDVMALFATNVACAYLLSWVILHEQFVGIRIVAVILCDTGIALLAYMDGITNSPTLGGVVLAACAAAGSATYKVLFKKVIGEATYGQVALFFSLIGLLNAVLLWPVCLTLYFTGVETFAWERMPWLALLGASTLSLIANLLGNFSVALTYDMFITLGLITAVPVSAALDAVFHDKEFEGMKLAGMILIAVGFFLVMFPDNWPDYITRLLRNIIMLSHSARWSRRHRHGAQGNHRRDVVDYRTGYIRSHLRSPSGRVR